jgi:hypothetical protein
MIIFNVLSGELSTWFLASSNSENALLSQRFAAPSSLISSFRLFSKVSNLSIFIFILSVLESERDVCRSSAVDATSSFSFIEF